MERGGTCCRERPGPGRPPPTQHPQGWPAAPLPLPGKVSLLAQLDDCCRVLGFSGPLHVRLSRHGHGHHRLHVAQSLVCANGLLFCWLSWQQPLRLPWRPSGQGEDMLVGSDTRAPGFRLAAAWLPPALPTILPPALISMGVSGGWGLGSDDSIHLRPRGGAGLLALRWFPVPSLCCWRSLGLLPSAA